MKTIAVFIAGLVLRPYLQATAETYLNKLPQINKPPLPIDTNIPKVQPDKTNGLGTVNLIM